jgi:hypothetical protein
LQVEKKWDSYVELVPSGIDSPGEVCEKKKRGKGEESDSKGVFGSWWLGDKNGGRRPLNGDKATEPPSLLCFPLLGTLDIGVALRPFFGINVVLFCWLRGTVRT